MSILQTRTDSLEHGDLAALVCIDSPDLQEIVIDQLSQLGFGIHTASTAEEAIPMVYAHSYNIVATSEDFGGADVQTHPLLAELSGIPLDLRQSMFVCLIGPNMVTESEMQAFTLSIDLTVLLEDVPNLKTIVGRAVVRQEEFYKAYNAVKKRVRSEG